MAPLPRFCVFGNYVTYVAICPAGVCDSRLIGLLGAAPAHADDRRPQKAQIHWLNHRPSRGSEGRLPATISNTATPATPATRQWTEVGPCRGCSHDVRGTKLDP